MYLKSCIHKSLHLITSIIFTLYRYYFINFMCYTHTQTHTQIYIYISSHWNITRSNGTIYWHTVSNNPFEYSHKSIIGDEFAATEHKQWPLGGGVIIKSLRWLPIVSEFNFPRLLYTFGFVFNWNLLTNWQQDCCLLLWRFMYITLKTEITKHFI